jgi:hypothetical protein
MYYSCITKIANNSQILANPQTQAILQPIRPLSPIRMEQTYHSFDVNRPESLMPPEILVEKWKQNAYRERGCAFDAYDMVIEEAAKWGYLQGLLAVQKTLNQLSDQGND